MGNSRWMLGVLTVASMGLFACNSSTSNGSLTFSIAESLLVLEPQNAGFVLLSSATGNCAALQSGLPVDQVADTDFLLFLLGVLDASGDYVALTAGSYTILDPNASFNPPGLIANAAAVATDSSCNPSESDASGGTLTLSPFNPADGGTSTVTYTAVFSSTQISGTYSLTTCLTNGSVGTATCTPCDAPADGGSCVIQQ